MTERIGRYGALGSTWTIEASASIASTVRARFADLELPSTDGVGDSTVTVIGAEDGVWHVAWDAEPASEFPSPDEALHQLLGTISDRVAVHAARTHLVLHAAALDFDGAVIACVGPSGAGKSTLALGAALRGARHVSDELCIVDADGHVQPFHRPIGLRSGGAAVLGITIPDGPFGVSYPVRASDHGALSQGGRLTAVVLIERHDGPAEWSDISSGRAMYRLAQQTIGVGDAASSNTTACSGTAGPFRRLETVVRTVPTRVLRYSKIDAAFVLLQGLRNPG